MTCVQVSRISALLIRGFNPVDGVIAYGRDLIPLVRAEVQRREQLVATARP